MFDKKKHQYWINVVKYGYVVLSHYTTMALNIDEMRNYMEHSFHQDDEMVTYRQVVLNYSRAESK